MFSALAAALKWSKKIEPVNNFTWEEFEQLKISFKSDNNPITKQPIDLTFKKDSFEQTSMPLF